MANLKLARVTANQHSLKIKQCMFFSITFLQCLHILFGFGFKGISMLGMCWMDSLKNPTARPTSVSGWILCEIT